MRREEKSRAREREYLKSRAADPEAPGIGSLSLSLAGEREKALARCTHIIDIATKVHGARGGRRQRRRRPSAWQPRAPRKRPGERERVFYCADFARVRGLRHNRVCYELTRLGLNTHTLLMRIIMRVWWSRGCVYFFTRRCGRAFDYFLSADWKTWGRAVSFL